MTRPCSYRKKLLIRVRLTSGQRNGKKRKGKPAKTSRQAELRPLILLKDCTATTGFVAADATTPRVLTATSDGATGLIVAFDEALKTIGGIGDILVEMQDSADLYATAADTLTATSGTGVATQGVAGTKVGVQHQPGVHTIRFATDRRYVRAEVTAADNIGKCWILLTNHAFETIKDRLT